MTIKTTCKKCGAPLVIKCWREDRVCLDCDAEAFAESAKRLGKVKLFDKKGRVKR